MEYNFQSDSKKSGDEFEDFVLKDLQTRGFSKIDKNIYMPGTGCEVDFIAYGERDEYVESKGGRDDGKKRPGAQRTDNVKKAIANGALIKVKYPDIYYVVYFSAKPITGSYSHEMIEVALFNKIINEVRYLKYEEPDVDNQLLLFYN
jgi:hypothetical protein